MEIFITDDRLISDIQKEFNGEFPFLKIEFFRNFHKRGEPSPKSQLIPKTLFLGQVRSIHTEGKVNMNGGRSVEEIQNEFQNTYGLSIQVFRKSGNVWIETNLTDHWSLLRQNYQGQQLARLNTKPDKEEMDYREMD